MKWHISIFFFLFLFSLASCAKHPANSKLRKHLSQISYAPPKQIHYTRTISVFLFQKKIFWNQVPKSFIKTSTLTKDQRSSNPGTPLMIQAAENNKKIYFRIEWHDSPHFSSNPTEAEKLAFNWNVHSFSFSNKGCDSACHFVPPSINPSAIPGMWLPRKKDLVDNWLWTARTISKGTLQSNLLDQNLTGNPVLTKAGSHFIKSGFVRDLTPQILNEKSNYHHGKWTVLISRSILTTNPKETQFKSHTVKTFGISVFPGTIYHEYSGILTLLEKPITPKK